MRNKILFILLISPLLCLSQQDTKISLDSSSNNIITVNQKRADSSQEAELKLKFSDSNKLLIQQGLMDSTFDKKDSQTSIQSFLTNTYTILSIIVLIGTIIGWFLIKKKK